MAAKTYRFTFEVCRRQGFIRRFLNRFFDLKIKSKLVDYAAETSRDFATDALAQCLKQAKKDGWFVIRISSAHV